ncbi:hypothetical protein JCM3765_007074 [Sporobolomyces pararoseus]
MGQFASTQSNRRGEQQHGNLLQPTVRNARYVAALLVRGKRVPVELAIEILKLAEYTPKMTTISTRPVNVQAGWSGNRQSIAILQTPAIPSIPDVEDDVAVERIRIYTESHDQGFSSFPEFHNTREASSSWFELALVRSSQPPSAPPSTDASASPDTLMPGSLPPTTPDDPSPSSRPVAQRQSNSLPVLETIQRIRLYSNLHANRAFSSHSITLERRDEEPPDRARDENDDAVEVELEQQEKDDEKRKQNEFIKLVRPGDRLVLYAMAQYPAWSNVVRECRIDVEMKAL